MTVRIAMDAMGGDHAPGAVVRGAVAALTLDSELEIVLVGDAAHVSAELDSVAGASEFRQRIEIIHASQIVEMDDSPTGVLKAKKDSSLVRMVSLAAKGEVDAVLSAGHTGACAAACQLMLKPLPSVSRAGIAVTIPSFHGPFVLCDVGANIQAKPRHLYEYAVMATLYAERVLGIANPRVALISVGEENGKGTGLVKQTHELLRADPLINFVGNAEGRDLFENRCDVAICDGFVGNIVLKLVEGMAEGLFKTIASEFDDEAPQQKARFLSALDDVRRRHDYSRYGGAPLLGINRVCIICHGRSNETAICNAVGVARCFVDMDICEAIESRLGSVTVEEMV